MLISLMQYQLVSGGILILASRAVEVPEMIDHSLKKSLL